MLRKWTREQFEMHARVRNFQSSAAQCHDERDRPIVQHSIISLMRVGEYCDERVSEEEALNAFDAIVHTHVSRVIQATVGRTGLPYRSVLVLFQSNLWAICDRLCALLIGGSNIHALCALTFAVFPICYAIPALFCKAVARSHRMSRVAVYVCVWPCVVQPPRRDAFSCYDI